MKYVKIIQIPCTRKRNTGLVFMMYVNCSFVMKMALSYI